MNRIKAAVLALTAGVVVLTGWSSDVGSAFASPTSHASVSVLPASRGTITITNYMFSGPGKVLARGATVTVRNRDSVAHTVTSNKAHLFSVRVGPHKTVTFKVPKRAGRYGFHCGIHSFMKGTLTVR
jgi:plastocyanin